MMRKSKGEYPDNWKEIADKVKEDAGWKCVRCGHEHDPANGYCLTVHHLDIDPSNCNWWNIPPLCQRCHLSIQSRVVMERTWMMEHSEWFKPFVSGYYAHMHHLPDERGAVENNIDYLIKLGQGKDMTEQSFDYYGTKVERYSRIADIPKNYRMALWDGDIPKNSKDTFIVADTPSGRSYLYKLISIEGAEE